MKVSVIVAVYKDVRALELIFESLSYQTYKNFEVVVAEDGQDKAMAECVKNAREVYDFEIKHTTQEDKGVRKARSQNNGILASKGEYLIFIDGDCVLYSTFIQGHVSLSRQNRVLSGRRVNLNEELSLALRDGKLKSYDIEKSYLKKYFYLAFDKTIKYEQGIYIDPKGILYKFLQKRKRNVAILGCNFSCWKKDMVEINGFDEGYGGTAISDDTDLDWRFRAKGIEIISCKNVANMFHLWHKTVNRGDDSEALARLQENQERKIYICEEGLNKK